MAERLSTGFVDAVNATGSVKAVMASGIIRYFTGPQPASADLAETGDMLLEVTLASGAFVSGVSTNGLNMGTSSGGVLSKAAGEVWSGVGTAAAGTSPGQQAGWFRWYDNDVTTGASTTAIRVDGAVGDTSSYEARLSNKMIVEGVTCTIDTFTYTPSRQ